MFRIGLIMRRSWLWTPLLLIVLSVASVDASAGKMDPWGSGPSVAASGDRPMDEFCHRSTICAAATHCSQVPLAAAVQTIAIAVDRADTHADPVFRSGKAHKPLIRPPKTPS